MRRIWCATLDLLLHKTLDTCHPGVHYGVRKGEVVEMMSVWMVMVGMAVVVGVMEGVVDGWKGGW